MYGRFRGLTVPSMWICSVVVAFSIPQTSALGSCADASDDPIPSNISNMSSHRRDLVSASSLPLRTWGRWIVDRFGVKVNLRCVNWYGAHLEQLVANGLNRQPVQQIANAIADLGFNCVRLPFSLDMILDKNASIPNQEWSLAANPELLNSTPFEAFDATVSAVTSVGVLVILNNHVSSSMWCCSTSDGEGLWYTDKYSEQAWLDSLENITARYKGNPLVMGFDIRNEVRPSYLGTPTWGGGGQTDWAIASKRAALHVLSHNPDMLIFISGLHFGIFLCDVPAVPIHEDEDLRHRIVYTVHEYKWFNSWLLLRTGIDIFFKSIAVWFVCLWLYLCIGQRLPWERCICSRRCDEAVGRLRRFRCFCVCRKLGIRRRRDADTLLASVLTAVWLLCSVLTVHYFRPCKTSEVFVVKGIFVVSSVVGVGSLLLWMRIAFGAALCLGDAARDALEGMDATRSGALAVVRRSLLRSVSNPRVRGRLPSTQSDPSLTVNLLQSPRKSLSTPSLIRVPEAEAPPRTFSRQVFFLKGLQWLARSKRCALLSIPFVILLSFAYTRHTCGMYERFSVDMDARWGFLLRGDHRVMPAPIWLGEFGTGSPDIWWDHMLRYLADNEIGWAYWPMNGETRTNVPEPFGILTEDGLRIRYAWLIKSLWQLMEGKTSNVSMQQDW